MSDELILVAGSTGLLGGTIVRRLRKEGRNVRALSRHREKLRTAEQLGAETFAGDMLDREAMDRACAGVTHIVSTANNITGKGPLSPTRIDEPMYRTLGAAARASGVRRWIHVSSQHLSPDSLVDFFRVKHRVDDIIRNSGVPWIVIQSSAFMDVWTGVLFGNPERPGPVATIFGRGDRLANFIAVDDVASFVLAMLADEKLRNETVDIGGPSEVTFIEFATAMQRAMGVPEKRRHVPATVLGIARVVARPFNEVAARFASMGYWTTRTDRRFPEWRESATRFGVTPLTVEQFAQRFIPHPNA